ncbi:hypothetical protein AGABI1DRAFT_67706 [Agaricus bisporus var. burnettii JB137-S8]|uniref:RCC1/BLIP-II protein n=1 Tax=Agaricus bisporus var. burnettii (strain JB137-S8 / ATCC MYA-4627 / FGSC 10392) TaxID=597362 RepID=K5XL78_AGABU|nr:uncharacterized protein AGABI1DRAFT_67706 [Agaricus bisporus var. burnettii JB137-S8]EKM84323.1 hypothetical protein AGABI1DRAFT_67706 [Agaricus bisporus var. burnettii JB137-S8]
MLNLLSAGSNAQGQLGNSTIDDSHTFRACSFAGSLPETLPPSVTNVIDVTNGSNHTLALLEVMIDGKKSTEVWGCGDGRKGQLGPIYKRRHTDQGSTTIFQNLAFADAFDKLGLGGYTITTIGTTWETSYLALQKLGKRDLIVSFGSNDFGDLGVGKDSGDKTVEKGLGIHVVNFSHIAVGGKSIRSAQSVTVEKLRTGQRHAIASLQVVWAGKEPMQILVGWGAFRHGQLGTVPPSSKPFLTSTISKSSPTTPLEPTYHSRPTLIMSLAAPSDFVTEYSLGIHHSVFLHASGHVSFRGSNRKNQTQGLDACRNICDIKCTWNGSYMLTKDNPPHVLSTGSNSHGQLGRAEDSSSWKVEVPIDEDSKAIRTLACGSEHSLVCVVNEQGDDEVWGWGWNEHGNLGVGHTLDAPAPLKMWPPAQLPENIEPHPVRNVWAGTGSSWILCGNTDGTVEKTTSM